MIPEKSPLKVRLKATVLIGMAAGAVLVVASSRSTPEVPVPPRQPRLVLRHERPALPEEIRPVFETKIEPAPKTADPAARVAPAVAPVIPSAMEEDLGLLREWILNLPAADLQAFDASGALNRCIAWIVAEVTRANPDPQSSASELDRFLMMLNVRLGVSAP